MQLCLVEAKNCVPFLLLMKINFVTLARHVVHLVCQVRVEVSEVYCSSTLVKGYVDVILIPPLSGSMLAHTLHIWWIDFIAVLEPQLDMFCETRGKTI